MGSSARMGLPAGIRMLNFLGDPAAAKGRLYAIVHPGEDGTFDARIVDEKGNVSYSQWGSLRISS